MKLTVLDVFSCAETDQELLNSKIHASKKGPQYRGLGTLEHFESLNAAIRQNPFNKVERISGIYFFT
jgi:hypothetical protein